MAHQALTHCRTIASFTDQPGTVTRTFLTPATRECQAYLSDWMNRLGMDVACDAVGNLRALYAAKSPGTKRLLVGSHIDTIPNAGAFDGVLGVVIGLMLVESLCGKRLPFAIEVIAFSEEEGVRFGIPFIGSRALIGALDEAALNTRDAAGVTIRQAIVEFGLDPGDLPLAALPSEAGAYLEFHIEQGPLLEGMQLPLGVVTAIVGQSRALLTFRGEARHAGTTPMSDRRDALCAAAEWITKVEVEARTTEGLVATVGFVEAKPGAVNVIPGEVCVSLDVRHASDEMRRRGVLRLLELADGCARKRGVNFDYKMRLEQDAVALDERLVALIEPAIRKSSVTPHRMTSGAGHDAMILAPRVPSGMVFLRTPNGISHHPDETVWAEDIAAALQAGSQLLHDLSTCPYLT